MKKICPLLTIASVQFGQKFSMCEEAECALYDEDRNCCSLKSDILKNERTVNFYTKVEKEE